MANIVLLIMYTADLRFVALKRRFSNLRAEQGPLSLVSLREFERRYGCLRSSSRKATTFGSLLRLPLNSTTTRRRRSIGVWGFFAIAISLSVTLGSFKYPREFMIASLISSFLSES